MGRGSYAKRLTGQISPALPVLKPLRSPFWRWSVPPLEPMVETAPALSLPQATLAKAPESAVVATASPPPIAASPPAIASPAMRQVQELSATPASGSPTTPIARPLKRAKVDEPPEQRVSPKVIAGPKSNHPATIKAAGIDQVVPSFRSTGHRTKPKPGSEQTGAIESRHSAMPPADAQPHPAAVSFLPTKRSSKPAAGVLPIQHDEIVLAPRNEPAEARGEASRHPLPSMLALQPDSKHTAAPLRLESRPAERPASAAPQPSTAGGIHIGALEVRIMPPAAPAPPIIRPVQPRPAPTTVLSRSFTSALGLTQGQ